MGKHKDFIKKAYRGELGLEMPQDWKDKILENYPEFKEEEFKVGDWIKPDYEYDTGIYRITGFDELNDPYVEATNGKESGYFASDCEKATPKEIEQHLIKEAERRGFLEGVHFKALKHTRAHIEGLKLPLKLTKNLNLIDDFSAVLYDSINNTWAEIIPTMTKEEAEAKLNCKIVD